MKAHLNEADFLVQILDLCHLLRWRTYHARPGRTAHGWRTAVQGDGKGWPDIFAVRGDRALAIELKTKRGALSEEQGDWLTALEAAGVETHIWRADMDFDEAVRVLQ